MKHTIQSITPNSIAEELGITPGDILLSINQQSVRDVLDFRFLSAEEELLVEIEKPNGEIWELEIEKDEDEELGLVFASALMDSTKTCRNKCVFCFIDQLPRVPERSRACTGMKSGGEAGYCEAEPTKAKPDSAKQNLLPVMRDTLYIKDDDPRLSFLTGNYVTLTNMTEEEIKRIAGYHLSPLRISVHASDPGLREKMMGINSNLFDYLQLFNNAGIVMHFQIVLCKGLNDKQNLDQTIKELLTLQPGAASLSVVPAGLTRYREGLYPLMPFSTDEAKKVIAQVHKWQAKCKSAYGTSFVFCADEWYLQARMPLPPYEHYEDFPQLENGVGMMALFAHEFLSALPKIKKTTVKKKIGIITGTAAADFMRTLAEKLSSFITVYEVTNDFFGPLITVSGLLTGKDIIAQLQRKITADLLFIPQNAFRANTQTMLDGTTLQELSEVMGVPIAIGSGDGGLFAEQIFNFVV